MSYFGLGLVLLTIVLVTRILVKKTMTLVLGHNGSRLSLFSAFLSVFFIIRTVIEYNNSAIIRFNHLSADSVNVQPPDVALILLPALTTIVVK